MGVQILGLQRAGAVRNAEALLDYLFKPVRLDAVSNHLQDFCFRFDFLGNSISSVTPGLWGMAPAGGAAVPGRLLAV